MSWYEIFEPKVAKWEARKDLPKLLAGLSNRDPEVRCLAYDALGRLRLENVSLNICQALAQENSASARCRGAIALGRLGGDEAMIMLCHMLGDQEGDVRAAATRGLGKQNNSGLMSLFCALLEDDHEAVVVEAIYALGQLCNYRAVTSLHRLFDRCERAVREIAANAINSINLNQPMGWPDEDVYFFTYTYRNRFICECYSYKLVAWRNYLRRRWQYPFARDWGIGFWDISTLGEHLTAQVLRPKLKLEICDRRA